MRKIKLFCFPYAGGSAVVFSKWKQYLSPDIELKPVELAGRGRRIHESLYDDITDVVEDVFSQIKEELTLSPYAFFGHSMGCLVAYELAQKIRNSHLPSPLHIFFSGRGAPHIARSNEKKYHLLSNDQFKQEVIKLGGTPPEFFEYPELLELFLPVLKNDFKITETALPGPDIFPFDDNITVFLGKDDDLTPEQCDGWKKHTNRHCVIHYFNGGHFFLHDEAEQLVGFINGALTVPRYSNA